MKYGTSFVVLMVGSVIVVLVTPKSADPRHPSENIRLIRLLVDLATMVFVVWGCIDLAGAKGHGSGLVLLLVGLCYVGMFILAFLGNPLFATLFLLLTLFIGLPLFILFGLNDRTRRRRHRRC